MQVADPKQLTTSATLGGHQAISFGISEDPAFFQILSSSLYNNPNLAVVRETICNSWDAHIEAGLEHLPILIHIDEDGWIRFRDYGKGIPTDKIGQVYGTYGASTKKANTATTGGFGLGCKSPFAYTDSFQVTSMNQGKMSIYNVTKSSIETDGKPGIIPIITNVDTDMTGLEVKFQLRPNDVNEFIRYIKSIVCNGEIKAILRQNRLTAPGVLEEGDVELPVLGMSFEPGSYNFSDNWHYSYMGSHAVFVRYGNVMYPATQSPATEEALGLINNFMNIIGANRIVVQAAPSTLAIAPSRETLSNQKMTDDGIVEICVNLVDKLEAYCKAGIPAAIKEIEECIRTSESFSWYDYESFLGYVDDRKVRGYMQSSLWAKQRRHYTKHWKNLSINRFFEQDEFTGLRLNMNKAKLALRISRHKSDFDPLSDFLQRYVVLPQLAKWKVAGIKWSGHVMPTGSYGCTLYKETSRRYLRNNFNGAVLGLIKTKNVIVTKRLSDCDNSFDFHPDYHGEAWKRKCNDVPGWSYRKAAHVVHVGAKAEYAAEAVLKYTAMGYRVIDLTQEHDWDKPGQVRKDEAIQAAATRARRKQELLDAGMAGSEPNRLISINCLLGERSRLNRDRKEEKYPFISYNFAAPETWEKNKHIDVATPVFYIRERDVSAGYPQDNPKVGSMHTWNDLTDEVKATTVICRNKTEVNKAIKRGAVHLDDKRYKELFGVITTKEFKKYVTEQRLGFLEYLGMEGGEWQELLSILGIKHKVLEGMVDKPEFNWAYNFLDSNRYADREKLVALGCMGNVDGTQEYAMLTHLKSFKHLQALYDLKGIFHSSEVGGPLYLSSIETVLEWVKEHPEDIPAYKTLIRNAITKRKGKYSR